MMLFTNLNEPKSFTTDSCIQYNSYKILLRIKLEIQTIFVDIAKLVETLENKVDNFQQQK